MHNPMGSFRASGPFGLGGRVMPVPGDGMLAPTSLPAPVQMFLGNRVNYTEKRMNNPSVVQVYAKGLDPVEDANAFVFALRRADGVDDGDDDRLEHHVDVVLYSLKKLNEKLRRDGFRAWEEWNRTVTSPRKQHNETFGEYYAAHPVECDKFMRGTLWERTGRRVQPYGVVGRFTQNHSDGATANLVLVYIRGGSEVCQCVWDGSQLRRGVNLYFIVKIVELPNGSRWPVYQVVPHAHLEYSPYAGMGYDRAMTEYDFFLSEASRQHIERHTFVATMMELPDSARDDGELYVRYTNELWDATQRGAREIAKKDPEAELGPWWRVILDLDPDNTSAAMTTLGQGLRNALDPGIVQCASIVGEEEVITQIQESNTTQEAAVAFHTMWKTFKKWLTDNSTIAIVQSINNELGKNVTSSSGTVQHYIDAYVAKYKDTDTSTYTVFGNRDQTEALTIFYKTMLSQISSNHAQWLELTIAEYGKIHASGTSGDVTLKRFLQICRNNLRLADDAIFALVVVTCARYRTFDSVLYLFSIDDTSTDVSALYDPLFAKVEPASMRRKVWESVFSLNSGSLNVPLRAFLTKIYGEFDPTHYATTFKYSVFTAGKVTNLQLGSYDDSSPCRITDVIETKDLAALGNNPIKHANDYEPSGQIFISVSTN